MPSIMLVVLVAVLLFVIHEALRPHYGLLQYPFLASCGFLGFLVPQAIGVIRAESAPEACITKSLIMCVLCILALHLGWNSSVPDGWLRPPSPVPPLALYGAGVSLLAVGLAAFLKIAAMSGGVASHYSVGGHYGLKWSGMPVVYSFFVQLLEPGFALASLAALRMRSIHRLAAPALAGLIFLASIAFLGRRTMLVWVCIAVMSIAYFSRGITAPRWIGAAVVPLMALAIIVAPEYRRYSQFGGDFDRIRAIAPAAAVDTVLNGTKAEFWTIAHIIEVTDREGLFDFGKGFYNAFVHMYVPKLLAGEEGKQALLIEAPSRTAYDSYGWQIPYGMVPGGPATAFGQFWYAGCVIYFFIARWMRYLWVRATAADDILFQALYAASAVYGVTAAVTDIYAIYMPFFQYFLPLVAYNAWLRTPAGRTQLAPAPPNSRPAHSV